MADSNTIQSSLGPLGQLLSQLTNQPAVNWDITEGSYISNFSLQRLRSLANPVRFLVVAVNPGYKTGVAEIRDSGGRRRVKIAYPYVDGQTTDDLGRGAESFDITVMFFGNNYKTGLNALISELNQPGPGILQHPVRGPVPVAFETHEYLHSSESRKAVLIRLHFTEHTFSIQSLSQQPGAISQPSQFKNALLTALGVVQKISTALSNVQAFVFATRSEGILLAQSITNFSNLYTGLLQTINVSFGVGTFVDTLSILPVNNGGNGNPNGTAAATVFPVLRSASDPFTSVQQSLQTGATTAITIAQATILVNQARDSAQALIDQYNAAEGGLGGLVFYSDVLSIVQSGVYLQNLLQAAKASSNPQVIPYTTPRLMSVREVCFAVGIDVNRSIEVELLNPELESVNYIPQGTLLTVPAQ